MKDDEADNPFPRWMQRSKLTVRQAAEALGASPSAVQNWKRKKPPLYVLLACAAWSVGQPPIQ